MVFLRVAGASLRVRRRSESQPKIEPSMLDADTLSRPAGVHRSGRQRIPFVCPRRRNYPFSQTKVPFSCTSEALSAGLDARS